MLCTLFLLQLGALSPAPQSDDLSAAPAGPLATAVAEDYVAHAQLRFRDALDGAVQMNRAIQAFLRAPSEELHLAAKEAWLEAHTIYSHCEVFRFGNPNVDAWQGKVNAWPMDEGLIDYVAEGYVFHEGNPFATWNIVSNGDMPIDDELIAAFAEGTDPKAAYELRMSDVESNVTTGYHALEFLLWGQDLNAESDAGRGGHRPYTDYVVGDDCTNGRCDRRRQYLSAAAGLLMYDLRFAANDWAPEGRLYGKTFRELPLEERLDRILIGMGSLSYAEVASERIRVALLTGDQEEEQSCFSDTTHLATLNNVLGIETLYLGRHVKRDGTTAECASMSSLIAALDPELDAEMRRRFTATREAARAVADRGEAVEPFDAMIAAEDGDGRALLEALIARLFEQAELLETIRGRVSELAQL